MTARNLRLTLLAIAVLALGLALYLWKGRGSSTSSTATRPAPGEGSGATAVGRPPAGRPGPGARRDEWPAEPGSAGGSATGPRTYVMDDGSMVRDHRAGGGQPPVATTPMPPEQRTMNPELTARVYQQVSPAVAGCAAKVPTDARGADPFVYINLNVEVDGGVLSATDVLPVAHDVEGDAAEALVACVREGVARLRVDATGEPDQAAYVLQYPIKLR